MNKKISLASIIFMVAICFSFSVVPAFAETNNVSLSQAGSISKYEEEAERYMVYEPGITITAYYMAVQYKWIPGINGDYVSLSNNDVSYGSLATEYTENAFPSSADDRLCIPYYKYGKTYDSRTARYSPVKSLEHDETMVSSDGSSSYILSAMGFKPMYDCEGYFDSGSLPYGSTVPTSFNQNNYKWDHNHAKNNTIKATIEYMGVIANFNIITIPGLFAVTTTVNLNGVDFVMRVGFDTVQLKTNNSGVSAFNLKFAFGVDPVEYPSNYNILNG